MGRQNFTFDWLVLSTVLILVVLGLMTLLSIDKSLFYQQLQVVLLSLGLLILFSRTDFRLWYYLDKYIYGLSIFFLILTFLGPEVRGATRWLELGGIRIQPSEIIKPFLLVSFVNLLVRYPPTKLINIGLHLGLFFLPVILVLRQPDLGNTIIYSIMWLGPVILSGIPLIFLIGGLILSIIGLPLFYNLLRDYQKLRIITFLNPIIDPRGAGYNAIQSLIAVGSGKVWGRGFGRGTQSLLKFLPERHTDFIFASYIEEFGFIGGLVLLLIFFILFYRMLKQAEARLVYQPAYLYITGFFLQLSAHVVINIGMNMGLLPITGITLPLMSYGRSSLIGNFIGLGIYFSAIQERHKLS